jgi:hypothetical protein
MIKIPDSMMLVTCGYCGHTDDFDLFTKTPVNGDTAPGTYQCPKCRKAWAMRPQGDGKRYSSGLVIPPTVKATPIPSTL